MALFHLSVTQTKRSAGQSAIASAAYRAGERLYSEYYGEYSDYTRKGGVICSDILLPSHAPPEYADRQTLWNAVEKAERGKNAQLAYVVYCERSELTTFPTSRWIGGNFMDFIWDSITDRLKEMLISGIVSNLSGMFDSTNEQVGSIIGQVGMTPQGWNGGIFTMIQNLSNTVILPIAGAILAIVMTLELIQLISDRNNLNDDVC